MQNYQVAHIVKQGVSLIIVPLQQDFQFQTQQEKQRFKDTFTDHARLAGLGGEVVLVWDNGFGTLQFFAHPNLHSFFSSIDWNYIRANINKSLSIQ
jgi:hypothetical protein